MKKDPRKKITKRYLLKLEFERKDYFERWEKLVKRVKLQAQQIEGLYAQIHQLESKQANDGLSHLLAKQRVEELEKWIALKRPDVLRLETAVVKQKAAAAAGVQRPINVTLVQRRRHSPTSV